MRAIFCLINMSSIGDAFVLLLSWLTNHKKLGGNAFHLQLEQQLSLSNVYLMIKLISE